MSDFKLRLLGTGSPRPQLERAGPCQVIEIPVRAYQVDCGDRATTQSMLANVAASRLTRLLFTHLHTDHAVGYAQFILGGWSLGRRELRVLGPRGTLEHHRVLFEQVYKEDVEYRLSLGRDPRGLIENVEVQNVEAGLVLEEDGLRVTAAWVVHQVPTLAYRFDYDGRSIVLSGDTTECEALVELARGADVLVQDCCLDPTTRARWQDNEELRRVWERITHEHCTPQQAGRMAAAAGVKKLVLTHFLHFAEPGPTVTEARRFYDGEIVFGTDLLELDA